MDNDVDDHEFLGYIYTFIAGNSDLLYIFVRFLYFLERSLGNDFPLMLHVVMNVSENTVIRKPKTWLQLYSEQFEG